MNRILISDIVRPDPLTAAVVLAGLITVLNWGGVGVLPWMRGHDRDTRATLAADERSGLAWLAAITALALWCSASDVSFH